MDRSGLAHIGDNRAHEIGEPKMSGRQWAGKWTKPHLTFLEKIGNGAFGVQPWDCILKHSGAFNSSPGVLTIIAPLILCQL